jgi:hypothetical protein
MKKPPNTFTIEVGKSAIIGIEPGTMLTIALRGGKTYSASVEKVHKAMAAWHAKEHPTGKKRRRLFTSSQEMKKYRQNHPEEFRS